MTDTKPLESTDQNPAHPERQTAMQDERIVERLEENPEDADAQLDAALDASMDGSDPISISQPARAAEPAPTDGQHGEEAEVRSNA
jgi:hypothetical protein